MSQWLFDLGNTRLKCVRLLEDGRLSEVVALGHDASGFVDALRAYLPAEASSAVLSSVASPVLTAAVVELLTQRFQRISQVRSQARFGGLRIAYPQPEKLGVDRFLALLAAHARGGNWVVAGVGTAVTVDLLAADGRHLGGRIAPSPTLMRQALHQAAAHLPLEGGVYAEFAHDTEDALASGCDGAALGLIDRSLREARQYLDGPPRLLLHGGGAGLLSPHLPGAELAPSLVLEGLARWSNPGGAMPDAIEP